MRPIVRLVRLKLERGMDLGLEMGIEMKMGMVLLWLELGMRLIKPKFGLEIRGNLDGVGY